MGYYSSRKPYYDLTKSQVEFFAGSSRFLKQSLVKESVMEKPYLEDEYQKMHLAIPPPIWPDWPPWGPFGPIWGVVSITLPPATCMLAHNYTTAWPFNWWNSCGDVTTIKFYAWSFFEEEWFWTYNVSSSEVNVEDLDISISENGISLSANIPGTKGIVLVCGTGTAGMIPLTLQATYLLGGPVPSLLNPPIAFTVMTTQLGLVHCCTETEFDCDSCTPDPAMAWDYDNSGETVAQDSSCAIAITGLNGPFSWSVSGTGFTLAEAETTGLANTLLADASSCGTATITVTGCDGNSVTGYVRGADGQWVFKSNTCGLGGDGTVTNQVNGRADYEKILGNKKQTQRAIYSGNAAYYGCWDPNTDCESKCGEFGCAGCITWICTDLLYEGDCGDYCCYTFGSGGENSCGGAGSGRTGYCVRISALSYWEWEC